jgi:hypothetical protein
MFNDYKTPEERLQIAGENDWYMLPIIIILGVIATLTFIGVDNFVEVMSDFIVGLRNN